MGDGLDYGKPRPPPGQGTCAGEHVGMHFQLVSSLYRGELRWMCAALSVEPGMKLLHTFFLTVSLLWIFGGNPHFVCVQRVGNMWILVTGFMNYKGYWMLNKVGSLSCSYGVYGPLETSGCLRRREREWEPLWSALLDVGAGMSQLWRSKNGSTRRRG
uniref:Uncharacterized protein n=1 Tax=Opuntia streptacantha TaxID=393608 RepID=A0A7C9DLQ8_OPUST